MGSARCRHTAGDVRVVCRVRPLNAKERAIAGGGGADTAARCVNIAPPDRIESVTQRAPETFTFDRVFDEASTQAEVFENVARPIVVEVMKGYNGTVFAYGQTSSGKTHTMEGPDIHDEQMQGIIPRAVAEVFRQVADADDFMEFVVKVSYVEVYMEKIRDLLDSYHTRVNLQVREDSTRGVYVAGATEQYVTSAKELLQVMEVGKANRATAATGMNSGSSRSHSVFIITIQQRNTETSSVKTGMLYLVDLAGSEMVKKTQATGQVLEEAKTINKSLSALGLVINALTDEKAAHVPYRDSKLTRVLQNSLGGNSKTCLIINCSPSPYNADETASTLRFGSRAKRIKNTAVVNETRSVGELSALLAKAESALELQRGYIAALEAQLAQGAGGGSSAQRPPEEGEAPLEGTGGGLSLLREGEARVAAAAAAHREERERADALEQELAARVDTAAAAESEARAAAAAAARTAFELEESQLTVETLTAESARLAAELQRVTGDAVATVSDGPMPLHRRASAASDGASAAAAPPPPGASAAVLAPPPPPSSPQAQQQQAEEGAGGGQEGEGKGGEEGGGGGSAHGGEEVAATLRREYERRLAEHEAQRAALTADLEKSTARVSDLEQLLEQRGAGSPRGAAANSMWERHVLTNKKMTQRLEQLVVVHRQLLRRFAGLELESADQKKKL
ncbi:kinesin-like protein, partial [Tribonema minus]